MLSEFYFLSYAKKSFSREAFSFIQTTSWSQRSQVVIRSKLKVSAPHHKHFSSNKRRDATAAIKNNKIYFRLNFLGITLIKWENSATWNSSFSNLFHTKYTHATTSIMIWYKEHLVGSFFSSKLQLHFPLNREWKKFISTVSCENLTIFTQFKRRNFPSINYVFGEKNAR